MQLFWVPSSPGMQTAPARTADGRPLEPSYSPPRRQAAGTTRSLQRSATRALQPSLTTQLLTEHHPGTGDLPAPTPHPGNAQSQGSSTPGEESQSIRPSPRWKRESHTRLASLPAPWVRQEDVPLCASCTSLAGTFCLDKQTVTRGNWSLPGEGQSSPGNQSHSMPVPLSLSLSWKTCYRTHAGTCNRTTYYMPGAVLGQLPILACRCLKSRSGFNFC